MPKTTTTSQPVITPPAPKPTAPPSAPPAPPVKATDALSVLRELLEAAPADLLTCLPLTDAKLERYAAARKAAEAALGK
jgi:hypothetical protein